VHIGVFDVWLAVESYETVNAVVVGVGTLLAWATIEVEGGKEGEKPVGVGTGILVAVGAELGTIVGSSLLIFFWKRHRIGIVGTVPVWIGGSA
jgi:hypothetical protein